MQLCDMSVSNPPVTPIHNGITCVNMVNLLQNGCMCVLKDIVDVKQLLDTISYQFCQILLETLYRTDVRK